MSAKPESQAPAGTTKKFGKGERHVPHVSAKAKRYYPAEADPQPKKVRARDVKNGRATAIGDLVFGQSVKLRHGNWSIGTPC